MSARRKRPISIALALVASLVFMCAACSKTGPSPDLAAHYIAEPEQAPVRPIESREEQAMSDFSGSLTDEQYRARVDELYSIVVDDGKKPVFSDGDPVKEIYDNAVGILDRYILNSWHSDADGARSIVHTLHDYLVCEISYDFALYDSSRTDGNKNDPAFYIDGVFLNKRAVCDGLSRAMNFMCAIEGVDCLRVTGSYAGVPHAWNKVKIDGAWYNVDVTADAANYIVDGGEYKKQLSHGYFLLSDETMRTYHPNKHVFDTLENSAVNDYDYYSNKTVTVGEETYPYVISDKNMLFNIFDDISKLKGAVGKIELKLKFHGKTNVNNADMYTAEIAEAYARLKDATFSMTSTQRPYFQYPNGVYVFLLYK